MATRKSRYKFRKFGGKLYQGYSGHHLKRDAQAMAERIRRNGGQARVVKNAGSGVDWLVFVRGAR